MPKLLGPRYVASDTDPSVVILTDGMHPTHPRSHIDLHDWDKIVLDPVRVKRQMLDTFSFERIGVYFNPAQDQLDGLDVVSYECPAGTMHYIGTNDTSGSYPMIAVTSGMSSGCSLKYGTRKIWDDYVVKELQLYVHGPEFDKIIRNLGRVLEFDKAQADYFNSALHLSTQAVHHSSSMDKASPAFRQSRHERELKLPNSIDAPALSYHDTVPIYDARAIEGFDLNVHLPVLSTLPIYENGMYDLPFNCAVVVGYAPGVFKCRVSSVLPYMTWSIRWVILLSLPALWVEQRIEDEFPHLGFHHDDINLPPSP